MEAATLGLTALAILVAWIAFRLERAASRALEIANAPATLLAVKEGIVEKPSTRTGRLGGWGDANFANVWDESSALVAGTEARRLIQLGTTYQVFPVPTEALSLLATTLSAGDLISSETV